MSLNDPVRLIERLERMQATAERDREIVLRPTRFDERPYFNADGHGNASRKGHGRDPAEYVPCPRCGRRHDPRSEICFICSQSLKRTLWDEAKIVAKAQEWFERYGRQPVQRDWAPAKTPSILRHQRFSDPYPGYWPSTTAVQKHVGGMTRLRALAFGDE